MSKPAAVFATFCSLACAAPPARAADAPVSVGTSGGIKAVPAGPIRMVCREPPETGRMIPNAASDGFEALGRRDQAVADSAPGNVNQGTSGIFIPFALVYKPPLSPAAAGCIKALDLPDARTATANPGCLPLPVSPPSP
jgi:phosphate transport system substrate-binding protein